MNDHELESRLRDLPGPALPAEWRASILATARCEARNAERNRLGANWPAVLLTLVRLLRRSPMTSGGLAVLWVLILVLKAGTPIDPEAERLIARAESGPPPQIMPLREELLLAQMLEDESSPRPVQQP
jgi:hypothetical protein